MRRVSPPKTSELLSKEYRYLGLQLHRTRWPYIATERVRCGKPDCRCAQRKLHGPYCFLRYRVRDEGTRHWRHKREYVRRTDLRKLRRLLRRDRERRAPDRIAIRMAWGIVTGGRAKLTRAGGHSADASPGTYGAHPLQ